MPSTIATTCERGVAVVTLRRPEVHNALNPVMIRELEEAFREISSSRGVRVAVLAADARGMGLVTETVRSPDALDAAVARWTAQLLANGPEAMAGCKQLVEEVAGPVGEEILALVSRRIAERRATDEGQEGMRAF